MIVQFVESCASWELWKWVNYKCTIFLSHHWKYKTKRVSGKEREWEWEVESVCALTSMCTDENNRPFPHHWRRRSWSNWHWRTPSPVTVTDSVGEFASSPGRSAGRRRGMQLCSRSSTKRDHRRPFQCQFLMVVPRIAMNSMWESHPITCLCLCLRTLHSWLYSVVVTTGGNSSNQVTLYIYLCSMTEPYGERAAAKQPYLQ